MELPEDVRLAVPVVGVVLCAVLVFAFGFKSSVQPPSFEAFYASADGDDDSNRKQKKKPKKSKQSDSSSPESSPSAKKSVATPTATKAAAAPAKPVPSTGSKQSSPVIEKVVSDQGTKSKVKKVKAGSAAAAAPAKGSAVTSKQPASAAAAPAVVQPKHEDDGMWTTVSLKKTKNKKDEPTTAAAPSSKTKDVSKVESATSSTKTSSHVAGSTTEHIMKVDEKWAEAEVKRLALIAAANKSSTEAHTSPKASGGQKVNQQNQVKAGQQASPAKKGAGSAVAQRPEPATKLAARPAKSSGSEAVNASASSGSPVKRQVASSAPQETAPSTTTAVVFDELGEENDEWQQAKGMRRKKDKKAKKEN